MKVMMGQGIFPQAYHPIATKLTDEELAKLLATIRETVSRTVAALPQHEAYVSRYCATSRAAAA